MVWLVVHGFFVISSQRKMVETNTSVLLSCYGSTGSIMSILDNGNEVYDHVLFKMNTIRNIIYIIGKKNKVLVSFDWK